MMWFLAKIQQQATSVNQKDFFSPEPLHDKRWHRPRLGVSSPKCGQNERWDLGTHLPVELSSICRLRPRSMVTDLHRGVWAMLPHRRAAPWTVVIVLWAGPLWVPLNSKLTKPGVGPWVLALKTAEIMITAVPESFSYAVWFLWIEDNYPLMGYQVFTSQPFPLMCSFWPFHSLDTYSIWRAYSLVNTVH